MEKIRVQKMIADCGYCSRRKAEELITKGKVKVNGHPVSLGDKCSNKDIITIDGERIYLPRKRSFVYIMMNKQRLRREFTPSDVLTAIPRDFCCLQMTEHLPMT